MEQKVRKRVATEKEAQIFRKMREVHVSGKRTGKDAEALTNR